MPRLSKGQLAPGVKSKSDSIAHTVFRRVEIFHELMSINNPPGHLLAMFHSVSTLAAWSLSTEGIFPVSVKTLRKHIGNNYADGLAALCQAARVKSNATNSKPAISESHEEKGRAEQAIDSALEMTARYLDLLERIRRLAHTSESIEMELSKHFRRFGKNPHVREVQ